MKKLVSLIVGCGLLSMLISGCASDSPEASAPSKPQSTLRIATWNIEHLAQFDGQGCLPRTEADYQTLRAFAKTIDADVVALQEVDNAQAMQRVFPANEWNIAFSGRADTGSYDCNANPGQRSTQQKVGFAIRKGVNYTYQSADNLTELELDGNGLRHGVVLTLTDFSPAVEVMTVHMKSGCFVADYLTSDRYACHQLALQAPFLKNWMEQRLNNKTPFIVLGDFNHQLANNGNVLWQQIHSLNGSGNRVENLTDILGCHPRYPNPIDHILASSDVAQAYVEGSAFSHGFGYAQGDLKEEDMLSDHCPVSVDLRL
ncbi:endonuclease/exonuclease/phosphatase family protein [Paraferrimonas haliotis]|uniref:Hydrolase n=1 Tax=Paraferrimonas haliotis TaxID=2013866 RepID=A0AA37WYT0_9GAMM|nr:endonuclease/exonuclease/phosphatase family protein [Paraferrimonas haliotis]GLS84080.1 hydrolase [Paraferrimonas haliotis]